MVNLSIQALAIGPIIKNYKEEGVTIDEKVSKYL